MPPTLPGDAEIRALAREILAANDYARWRWSPDDVSQSFLLSLHELFAWLDRLAIESPVSYSLLLAGLVLVAFGLLAHLVYALRRALASAEPPPPPVAHDEARDLVEEARGLAHGGRYLEASQRLQLACLALLVEREWIALRRHEPNATLRRRLQASPLPEAERRGLLALIDRLETAWFRDRLADAALYRDWLAARARLAALAAAPGARA